MKKLLIAPLFVIGWWMQAQTHKVAPKETPYSISRQYGLTLKELYELNPELKNGTLQIGQIVKVGKKNNSQPNTASAKYGKIILQPKQTLYGITKQYHITEKELRALNPNLEMKIGEEVLLPLDKLNKYADKNASAKVETTVAKPVEEVKEVVANTSAKVLSTDEYEVQPKDNYYKISRKFKISKKDLFAINPGLEERGLKVGDVIKIKYTEAPKDAVENTEKVVEEQPQRTYTTTTVKDDYLTYKVQAGDTVFGILNQFNVDLDDLLELNPQLSNGLKAGMVLRIKKLDEAYIKNNGEALNVVLMLPFGFDAGDSKYRNLSADFLTGAKLAVEMNAAKGQKLDFKVIDAGNENAFKKSLMQINRDNTDLIIGPLFKSNVVEVLDYVKDKKIPVVAPFANSPEMYGYGNLIIAETDKLIYADRIAQEVKEVFSDQKIYIVSGKDRENANYLKQKLEKSLKKPNIVLVNSASEIALEQNMMTGQNSPVIAILANDDDNIGAAFSSKIIELSKETKGIKAFSMFYTPSFDKNIDGLSQASLVYIMDRKINTEGSFEKEVLAAYNKKYCKTPTKYAVIGFDIVSDMLSRENTKGEVFKRMKDAQTQLATKFEFKRVKSGGAYVNIGYRVVRLLP